MTKRAAYIFLLLAFCGCQVIPKDQQLVEVPGSITPDQHPHVLIDYTGFRCVNCPKAAEQAQALRALYGSQLIVVAMHPASNPFTQGLAQYDYTCPEADVYYRFMSGTATTPFPTGNVDIMPHNGSYLMDYTDWPARVTERMKDVSDIRLSASALLDTKTNNITVLTTAYAGTVTTGNLVLWLIEDNVPGAQQMPDGSTDMNYLHRHLLRAAAGEPWGKTMTLNALPICDTTTFLLPEQCKAEQCSVVALFTDTKDHSIYNATQTNIQ